MSRGGNYRFLHGKALPAEVFCRIVAKNLPSNRFSRSGASSAAMMAIYMGAYPKASSKKWL